MSTSTYAPPVGGFDDDFAAWETELSAAQRGPLAEPRVPQHLSRAAGNRQAAAQADEGLADWLRERRA